jgi:hypothetical protein
MAYHPGHGARDEVGKTEGLSTGVAVRRYTRRA